MEFLYTNVLFLMLIPVLVLIFLIATNKDSMQKIFPQTILNKLSISNKHMTKTTRNTLLFIALILMILALSRPVFNKQEIKIKQEITPIVVAIDISKSMLANDIFPTRLKLAKKKLLTIIEQSKHNGIGVILFAKSAFILSPITQDFNSLQYLVENFDNGLNFDNGSNIHAVLEATNKLLKNYQNKNLLLLTDGANNTDFTNEIEYANNNKINVYTLGLATSTPTPIKIGDKYLTDKNDNIVTVALNESIKELSLNTQGGYIPFSLTNNDINAILKDIETQSQKDELRNKKHKTYTELFYYPLALALFILLIAFSSLPTKKGVLALLLISFFVNPKADASLLDFQTIKKANEAYENKDYKKASKEFHKVSHSKEGHYNLANAYYKEGKYKKALTEYKQVISSDKILEYQKLHNMGNSYVKLNKLEDAKKMYEKALKLKKDQQTQENLDAVNNALNKKNKDSQSQSGEKKNDKKKQSNKKSQDKSQKNDKKKEQQKNQEKKKQKQQDQANQNSENKKEKSKSDEKNKKQNTQEQKIQQQNLDEKAMSDREEKKWLQHIQKQKAPVLLRKVESEKPEEDTKTPW